MNIGPLTFVEKNSDQSWVLVSLHHRWSLTWRFYLHFRYLTRRKFWRWGRIPSHIAMSKRFGFGGFCLGPLSFNWSWQANMRRKEYGGDA